MRRIVTWLLSTITVVVLLFGYHTSTSGPVATGPRTVIESGTGSTTTSGTSGGSTGSSTVKGDVVDTRWGPVQVQITTSSGKITDVTVLQYPDGNPKDQEINDYALPVLVKETIDEQSASIDMVSGATVTSEGYVASLQAAIDEAGL